MFCSKCGKEIDDSAVVCVHCGCATENMNKKDDKKNDPIIINNNNSVAASASAAAAAASRALPLVVLVLPSRMDLRRKRTNAASAKARMPKRIASVLQMPATPPDLAAPPSCPRMSDTFQLLPLSSLWTYHSPFPFSSVS